MKKISLWAVVCLLLLSGCAQAAGAQSRISESGRIDGETVKTTIPDYVGFFSEKQVHDLYVDISEEDWQAILADPTVQEYCSVTVTIDGIVLNEAGFRTRGSSSLRMASRRRSKRYPFRLKFDKYVEDQRFLGLDELVLTNSNDDPSYLREYLGYEAFRQLGMDVPMVTFFNLYINGELHGLYVGVEAIDNRFLERAFDSHRGNLYKADVGATLMPDMDMEFLEQKKGSDKSKADAAELIRIIDEMPLGEKGELENILDVDSVLKYMAGNAVVHNWDDYAGQFAHNYYLYMDDGLFRMIPWDMNESFLQTQAMYRSSDGARQDIATPTTGTATLEGRPLVQKLFAVPEYYEQYLDYCEVLMHWLETLSDELTALRERLSESVKQDPTGFFSYEEFERQFDSGYSNGLAGFIEERAAYLAQRLPELMTGL